MNTAIQIILLLAALWAGVGVGRAGVLDGVARGGVDVTLGRWRLLVRTHQIREQKVYFQAVVLAA